MAKVVRMCQELCSLNFGRKLEVWDKRSSNAHYEWHPSHQFTSSNLFTPSQADDNKWRIVPRGTVPRGDVVVSDCASMFWICFFKKPLNHLTVLISCQREEWHFLPMRMSHCHQEEENPLTTHQWVPQQWPVLLSKAHSATVLIFKRSR